MRQQINLYQDALIEKRPPLHAGIMLAAIAGCIVLLVLVSILLYWQQAGVNAELAAIKKEHSRLTDELQRLKQQRPPRQKDPRIAQELEILKAELAGRKPLLAHLARIEPEMVQGFSSLIKGLARYPLQGIWLTRISLNLVERQVLLAGSATRADLIPTYLHHLGEKEVLKGQTFASLKLSRLKETSSQIDFRLESDFGVADE